MVTASSVLDELKAEVPEGVCLACDFALPVHRKGRRRYIHDSVQCRRLYYNVYAMGRRAGPGTLLRAVRERRVLGPHLVELSLVCGHVVRSSRCYAPDDQKRRFCSECAAAERAQVNH